MYNTIKQYYDLFVHVCNEIDPDNKEQIANHYKSDIDHNQLLAASGKTGWFSTSQISIRDFHY